MKADLESTPVWDLPVRVFHWILVALILLAWLSAGTSMTVHSLAGYCVIGLVIFRLWWGLAGSSTARFSSFVRGPEAVLAYVRHIGDRTPGQSPGHNPVGAISVLALLALILIQTGTGLFSVDVDGLESGPLSAWISFDMGRQLAHIHGLAFKVLEVLVGLHVTAILYYAIWKRENLVGPMITGRRQFSRPVTPMKPASVWRLLIGLALACGLTLALARGLRF